MADAPRTILVVDDEAGSRALLVALLREMRLVPVEARDGEEALAILLRPEHEGRDSERVEPSPDLVLLDVVMPDIGGLEVLKRYRRGGGRAPVIVCSASGQIETAIHAMRLGATDYVSKPFDLDEMRDVVQRALGVQAASGPPEETVAGNESAAMQRIGEILTRVAHSDVPVLLTGESGVGKDVAARQIHGRSPRSERVFIKINCAALPGELLESELFGHERGSFTGAARTKPGQFELANGGTLFLDEIGEMPTPLQAKLLQALQDGEFYRVGGQRRIRVDVRIVVATNRDLKRCIREGSFREDLYYRLNVVSVHIPPLRERREDIPSLLRHFTEKYGRRYGRPVALTSALVERFLEYEWPGNIRELENLVRRLAVLSDPGLILDELRSRVEPAQPLPSAPPPSSPFGLSPSIAGLAIGTFDDGARWNLKQIAKKAAAAAEREAIIGMLARTTGNKREAAQRLGVSYKAILYKIREYGIARPRTRPQEAVASAEGSLERTAVAATGSVAAQE